jgi:hypothetical protein
VDIWEYTRLIQDTEESDLEISVEDSFEKTEKFCSGMELRFGDGQRDDVRNVIESVDFVHKKITLKQPIGYVLPK